jgi:hypothetical protein
MAELKVFLTTQDFEDMIRFVFELGGKIIPDLSYDVSAYREMNSFQEFRQLRLDAKLLFVVHEDWFDEPLEMKPFKNSSGQTNYFIVQKSGGPTIDIFFNGEIHKDGHRFVGSGFIGYHNKYWSATRTAYRPQPDGLKSFSRSLVKEVKKRGTKTKGQKFVYWAGQHAQQELESGNLKISIEF